MTLTDLGAGNDVRALLLVHDGIRATVPQAARHVRALQPGDRRGARALVRWWELCARGLRRHGRATDAALWPLVLSTAPELTGEVRRLGLDLAPLGAHVELVAYGLERLSTLDGPEFGSVRVNLCATVSRLDIRLRRHLAAAEELALPVLRHRVGPGEWAALRAALVRPSGPRDTAALGPLFLDRAGVADRAAVPAPARALHDLVLGPRYRRLVAALPTR